MYIRCIGSTQHLKSKYGSEYVLELELAGEDPDSSSSAHRQTRIDGMIKELFAQSDSIKFVEQVADHIVYRVPQDCVGLISEVFSRLEHCKPLSKLRRFHFILFFSSLVYSWWCSLC